MSSSVHKTHTHRHDPIAWIRAHVELRETNSADALYDHMESQSGRSLPPIYVPFDGKQRGHFIDRGQILDFATSTGGGRVLDFGPGDGWPSLLLAPMVDEVVGVDGSRKRVEICTENARRLGITNVRFIHVPPGQSLPFDDDSFGGVTAASSVEQTPDPKATLKELYRLLKPDGRLRMHYESLSHYRGGQEREVNVNVDDEGLTIYDRHLDEEYVRHYNLFLDLTREEIRAIIGCGNSAASYEALTPDVLSALCARLRYAESWTTIHPSCRTLLKWLTEIGFRSAQATHNGGWFAGRLYDGMGDAQRPSEMQAVDEMLRPLAEVVATMEAPPIAQPGQWEPWITATK